MSSHEFVAARKDHSKEEQVVTSRLDHFNIPHLSHRLSSSAAPSVACQWGWAGGWRGGRRAGAEARRGGSGAPRATGAGVPGSSPS